MNNWIYIIAALGGGAIAQILKVIISYSRKNRLRWRDFITSGGMPSSHTALITSVALVIGLNQGFDSALFGLAATLWAIVVYDSIGVRRATGENSRILQNISRQLKLGNQRTALFLALGHTPYQVLSGFVLGLSWGFFINWLL